MIKLALVIATCFVVNFVGYAHATPADARRAVEDNAYARCVARLIEAKGLKYAVDHAGSTICERDAKRRLESRQK